MCFSATASFVASGIIGIVGIAAIKNTVDPKRYLFASIPFLFAIQQFCEGFVWLSLQNQGYFQFQYLSTISFLIFAQIIWPVMVPLSVLLMEKGRFNRLLCYISLFCGIIFSSYLAYSLSSFNAYATITDNHIDYRMDYPNKFTLLASALYIISTLLSLFASSKSKVKILGTIILLSFLVSKLYFEETFISVWCFFAAIQSVYIYFILFSEKRAIVVMKSQDF